MPRTYRAQGSIRQRVHGDVSCLQGLVCLTNLTRLVIIDYYAEGWQQPLAAVSTLTTLQVLQLPGFEEWPVPTPLSALR
jgi:hypothetical protein